MRALIFQNVEPQTVGIEATPQRTAPHDTVSDSDWSWEEDLLISEPADTANTSKFAR